MKKYLILTTVAALVLLLSVLISSERLAAPDTAGSGDTYEECINAGGTHVRSQGSADQCELDGSIYSASSG